MNKEGVMCPSCGTFHFYNQCPHCGRIITIKNNEDEEDCEKTRSEQN